MVQIPIKRTIDRIPGGMMILVPIITAWWYRRAQARGPEPAPAAAVQP